MFFNYLNVVVVYATATQVYIQKQILYISTGKFSENSEKNRGQCEGG